jgi:hypothetical protein
MSTQESSLSIAIFGALVALGACSANGSTSADAPSTIAVDSAVGAPDNVSTSVDVSSSEPDSTSTLSPDSGTNRLPDSTLADSLVPVDVAVAADSAGADTQVADTPIASDSINTHDSSLTTTDALVTETHATDADSGAGSAPIKIWMSGDSTMAGDVCVGGGWGSQFGSLFNNNVTVVNRSVAGRSIQTWLYEGNVSSTADANGECVLTSASPSKYVQAFADVIG